jgi:hypothetical protein
LSEKILENKAGYFGLWGSHSYPHQHHRLVEFARLAKRHSALHRNVECSVRDKLPTTDCDEIGSIYDFTKIPALISEPNGENDKVCQSAISRRYTPQPPVNASSPAPTSVLDLLLFTTPSAK